MRRLFPIALLALLAACEPRHHQDPIEEALAGPSVEDVEKDLGV